MGVLLLSVRVIGVFEGTKEPNMNPKYGYFGVSLGPK